MENTGTVVDREISVPFASDRWRGSPTRRPPLGHLRVPVGDSRVRSPLGTHGGRGWGVGQFECLGRPLRDRLPARRAFVTRDLAVFVVSTGVSGRHGLSLVGAVRGRTVRWIRHSDLLLCMGSGQTGQARPGRAAPNRDSNEGSRRSALARPLFRGLSPRVAGLPSYARNYARDGPESSPRQPNWKRNTPR